ncbi:ATP-binding protein [Streptomyces candidus]|uniref:Anti-sigma regulatory factor (Ser/Thr protein kinase) n=1 Tax=Streptomyces candidus TaxID=67283 RepID=A0A7X0HFX7_9ACTN|nr:ATP-binding protein [Streptomyces candidus]MBB6435577.1 anti-sigma regulatory factor (Ser/Thr protein kinase) [Streptomyces candidus]
MGLARGELRKSLASWGLSECEFTAVLVLSELLTNAVQHARVPGRQVATRFSRSGSMVRIEVHDASPVWPEVRVPDPYSCGGRGLGLVAELSDQWGVSDRTGVGKCVWAELGPG